MHTEPNAAPVDKASRRPDPALDAIAEHREAEAAYSAVLREQTAFVELHRAPDGSFGHHGLPIARALERRVNAASDRAHDAAETLIITTPATMAGLVAMLRYVGDAHADGNQFLDAQQLGDFVATLAVASQSL